MGSAEPAPSPVGIVDRLLARAATLGATRLLCIDGPSGSGKTTLAAEVADELEALGRRVAVVHMDDLYDGWDGLHASGHRLLELLQPLSGGRPGSYRCYDWHRGKLSERRVVPVTDVLVVEGVGSWRRAHAGLVTLLVWVEAPVALRLQRAVRRDGPHLEQQLRRWRLDEDALHAEEVTREHADVVVEGDAAD